MAPPPPSAAAGCSVRVAVRVRPLLSFEKTERLGECLSCLPTSKQLCVGDGGDNGRNTFTFDFTFPKACEQRTLYDDCVASLLEAFFEGFNATILAYGQTGSGKTYTMGSASSLRIAEEEQGIIPRVIAGMYDLLREAMEDRPNVSYSVRCQFLEIYGEDIRDLLEPAGSTVTIREGQNGEVNVHGAREMLVNGAEEMAMLLERGSLCRTTGSTLMNAHSSRSHAIFTVLLEQRIRPEGEAPVADEKVDPDDVEIRRSKFHFVDLAGSERAKRTGASGQRFKEGVDINKGLLTLGNVISALGDDTKRGKVHVPYRDSKLTRMLQDSLGGNSQTLMICCVSPAESNMHETLSALRYANRARNIQNKPVVNRDANSMVINELREKVQALASELLRIRSGGDGAGTGEGEGDDGGVSAAALRELAMASTPARQASRLPARALSARTGSSVEASAAVQRELTMLRARTAEAEGEVLRLTEEAKRAKKRESEKDDTLAEVRAELDLAHADMAAQLGGTGTDQLMADIAQAAAGTSGVESESPVSPKLGISGVIKGFFSGSGSTRGKSPGGTIGESGSGRSDAEEAGGGGGVSAGVDGSDSQAFSSGGVGGKPAAPRERALAVVKDFHKQIQALEEKLDDSERQRAALERRVVQQSGVRGGAGEEEEGGAGAPPVTVGLSAKLAAVAAGDTGELSTDAVAEAKKRLAEEKQRREQLIARLGAGSDETTELGGNAVSGKENEGGDVDDEEDAEDDDDDDDEEEEEDDDDEEEEEEEEESGQGTVEGGDTPGMRRPRLGSSAVTAHEEEMEADTLRGTSLEQERALRKSETRINAELSDLDKSIILKEALLAQIKEGQASYETMQQHYEHKLEEMDVEVHRHEQEHERLIADLEKLEKQTEVAVQEEREKLRKQLKDKTAALHKAKERQSELTVLSRDRRIKEDTVRGLESEIVRMKRNKVELQRRLNSEQKRQREILMQKSKEITSLKRSAAKDQAEVKRLERAKSKAEAVSRRHLDELALIRRLQRQKLGVGRKQKLTAQERETKKLLDAKLKELTRAEEAAERLSKEYEKKLLLLQQKESLELVKVSITSRRDQRQLRSRDARTRARVPPFGSRENRSDRRSGIVSPRPAARLGRYTNSPHQQQQQQQQLHQEKAPRPAGIVEDIGGVGAGGGDAAAMPPPPPIVESKEITLRAALPDEGGLDEEELDTLREVEERLESNKVQLEYKDRKIVSIQQEVDAWAEKRRLRQRGGESIAGGGQAGQGQAGKGGGGSVTSDGKQAVRRVEVGEAQMIEELESGVSDLKGAKGIIRVLFSSLVAARRGLKQKAGAAKVFQEQLDKKTLALEDTQDLRQTEQRSYDRKLTSVTAEYERKINGLINHTGMSGLLHAAIERSETDSTQSAGEGMTGPSLALERSGSSLEPGVGRRGVGGGGAGGGDITQDAMAKVLHERYLSERGKAKTLESRLKESEARIGDLEEVRKNERKAFADKQQDEEWLSYELRAYRSRCRELRDERDHLQAEVDQLRRSSNAAVARHASGSSSASSTTGSIGRGPSSSNLSLPLPPGPTSSSPVVSRPSSPPPPPMQSRPSSGRGLTGREGSHGYGAGLGGASPARRSRADIGREAGSSPEMIASDAGRQHGRMSPGLKGGVTSPEHPSSEVGSEYDDIDYGDDHESEAGDINFAGVTSDLEAIREGRMPESMQLVARVNAEAGGKVSVFDRLASTTTESRRQKVNDRDQLQEHLRRKAKQDAVRKKKDFKVIPAHLAPPPSGQLGPPASTSGIGGTTGHVSVADAIASLEGGKNFNRSASGADSTRLLSSSLRDGSAATLNGRSSLDDVGGGSGGAFSDRRTAADGGPKELSVFERLQATVRHRRRARPQSATDTAPSEPLRGSADLMSTRRFSRDPDTLGACPTRSPSRIPLSASVVPRRKGTGDSSSPYPSPRNKNAWASPATSPSRPRYSWSTRQAPTHHGKSAAATSKKYVKSSGASTTLPSRAYLHSEADHSRASSNGGSPPRLVVSGVDDKERSVNSDEALDVLEDQGTTARREKKSFSGTRDGASHVTSQRGSYSGAGGSSGTAESRDVFDRLPYKYTQSERKRRQPEAMNNSSRQPFSSRRSSQEKEAVALSAAAVAAAAAAESSAGGTAAAAMPLGSSRRSVELDAGGPRNDRAGR